MIFCVKREILSNVTFCVKSAFGAKFQPNRSNFHNLLFWSLFLLFRGQNYYFFKNGPYFQIVHTKTVLIATFQLNQFSVWLVISNILMGLSLALHVSNLESMVLQIMCNVTKVPNLKEKLRHLSKCLA